MNLLHEFAIRDLCNISLYFNHLSGFEYIFYDSNLNNNCDHFSLLISALVASFLGFELFSYHLYKSLKWQSENSVIDRFAFIYL
jgi:hypothetical protein